MSERRSEETIARGPNWRVTRPTQHHAFRVVQGLFSGVRGTSYINTVLNAAYLSWVSDLARRAYDIYIQPKDRSECDYP